MKKPRFDEDQLVTSTDMRKYGTIRKQAKEKPLVVTDNGHFDTVILDYKLYENMYSRLNELEDQMEIRILSERLESLEKNPGKGVNWRNIRRSSR